MISAPKLRVRGPRMHTEFGVTYFEERKRKSRHARPWKFLMMHSSQSDKAASGVSDILSIEIIERQEV